MFAFKWLTSWFNSIMKINPGFSVVARASCWVWVTIRFSTSVRCILYERWKGMQYLMSKLISDLSTWVHSQTLAYPYACRAMCVKKGFCKTKMVYAPFSAFCLGPMLSPRRWASWGAITILCFSKVLASSHMRPKLFMCLRRVILSSLGMFFQLV